MDFEGAQLHNNAPKDLDLFVFNPDGKELIINTNMFLKYGYMHDSKVRNSFPDSGYYD